MMRIAFRLFLVALFLVSAFPIRVYAQEPSSTALSVSVDASTVANFPQVTLMVTVRDAYGRVVSDIAPEMVQIFEDDSTQARPIVSVEPLINPSRPVYVILVLDISGSMIGQPVKDAKTAARALIERMGPQDYVALIAFKISVALNELDPTREHLFTTDHASVLALVDRLRAKGGTPLYDALYKAAHWAKNMAPDNRIIVLLTDGVDEDPGSVLATSDEAIAEAARANIPIFAIGYQGVGGRLAREFLQRAAQETGGSYQETPDSAQLIPLFREILERPRQQTRLVYRSGVLPDGRVHYVRVRVRVGDQSGEGVGTFGPTPFIPTPTPTFTPTAKPTVTSTSTSTPTATSTSTPTATATATAVLLPMATPSPTFTATPLPTATPAPTFTATPLPTATPAPTFTATPLPTATSSPTFTVTPLPTATPSPTFTATPLPTATSSPTFMATPLPTATPAPTFTATPLPTATPAPTFTATPLPTTTPALALMPSPTVTPSPTATSLLVATLSPTAVLSPTATAIPSPTATFPPVATPSPTTAPSPTATMMPQPTPTPTTAPVAATSAIEPLWLLIAGLIVLVLIVVLVILLRRRRR